MDLYVDSVI